MFLVKFSNCWADEFTCEELCLMTQEYFDQWYKSLKTCFSEESEQEFYFGTNEFFYYSSIEEVFNDIVVTAVSQPEEQDVLIKFLGVNKPFGTGSMLHIRDNEED